MTMPMWWKFRQLALAAKKDDDLLFLRDDVWIDPEALPMLKISGGDNGHQQHLFPPPPRRNGWFTPILIIVGGVVSLGLIVYVVAVLLGR